MRLGQFEAWVCADGIPLPELQPKLEKDERTMTCYIPAIPGQTFEVRWKDHGSGIFTAGYIYVDGECIPGRFLQGHGETMRAGARSGAVTERQFAFAELPGSTDAPLRKKSDVGTVKLKILQTERGPGRSSNKPYDFKDIVANVQDIESTGGLCATFSPKNIWTAEQSPFTWTSKASDDERRSKVRFFWKYRSTEWLQDKGLLPRKAPPHLYGMRPASEVQKMPPVPCNPPGRASSFVIKPDNLNAYEPTMPQVLPTTDALTGEPVKEPTKRPRIASGTQRSTSGSYPMDPPAEIPIRAQPLTDKDVGKRRGSAGTLVMNRPPSSRPPVFTGTIPTNHYILPEDPKKQPPGFRRFVQQQSGLPNAQSPDFPTVNTGSRSSSGASVGRSAPGSAAVSSPATSQTSPPRQGPVYAERGPHLNFGPGIGASPSVLYANTRRPTMARNASIASNSSFASNSSSFSRRTTPAAGNEDDELFDESSISSQ